jgi:hypothetical protein
VGGLPGGGLGRLVDGGRGGQEVGRQQNLAWNGEEGMKAGREPYIFHLILGTFKKTFSVKKNLVAKLPY